MAEIRVYPEGFRELARRVGAIRLVQVLQPPLIRGLERFRSSLATYPPKPEGSSYRRTGRLGRSWAISHNITARGIEGETGTKLEYAHWVQDEERQAWMHRDRWRNTDVSVANRHREPILMDFNVTMQEALRRAR